MNAEQDGTVPKNARCCTGREVDTNRNVKHFFSLLQKELSALIFPNVASELHLISFLVTHKNEVSQCDSNLSDRQIAEGPVLMN